MARPSETGIGLADLLDKISSELLQAQSNAAKRGAATMQFAECEVELAVQASKEGEAGIKIWVINLGGSVKRSESNTIRIKFTSLPEKVIAALTATESGPPLKKQSP